MFRKIAVIIFSICIFSAGPHCPCARSQEVSSESILTLPQAIDIALKNNPTIDAMMRAIGQSEYLYKAAAKEWLPVVNAEYSFRGFPAAPEIRLEGVQSDSGSDVFPIFDDISYEFGVDVKMPLYTGGAIQYKKEIARFGIDVAKIRLLEAKADLTQEVTFNYMNILRLSNYSKVVSENLNRFIEHEDHTTKNFDVGIVAKNSLLEIRAKRADIQQQLIEVEKDIKIARAALNVSMGVNVDSKFVLKEISIRRKIPYSPDECFEMARESNPTLTVFTYLKKIAEKSVELEKTETRPQLFASASYMRSGSTPILTGEEYISPDIMMAVVQADWKVFDWFKTTDLVNAKREEIRMLVDKLKGIEDRISLDIRQAHLEMKAARNKFGVARRGTEYAEENYRISKLRYDERVAKSTEVNDALVLLRQAQFNYYTAFYEYNMAITKLERIIGLNIRPDYQANLAGGVTNAY